MPTIPSYKKNKFIISKYYTISVARKLKINKNLEFQLMRYIGVHGLDAIVENAIKAIKSDNTIHKKAKNLALNEMFNKYKSLNNGCNQIPLYLWSRKVYFTSYFINISKLASSYISDMLYDIMMPNRRTPFYTSSSAVDIAKIIYEKEDYSLMPVLADILQETGNLCQPLLDHLRNDHVFSKASWIIVRLLKKQKYL